jgi:hypothetical protein
LQEKLRYIEGNKENKNQNYKAESIHEERRGCRVGFALSISV